MRIASEKGVRIISALGLICLVGGIGTFVLAEIPGDLGLVIYAIAALGILIGLLLVLWGNNLQTKTGKGPSI